MDGRTLDEKYLQSNNIKVTLPILTWHLFKHGTFQMLAEFEEPYHGRPLTYGEIGCFMSHFNIWQDMVVRDLQTVLILEDDIR